jgi:hypothetical protein
MKNFYTFKNLSQEQNILHFVTQKEVTAPYSFSLALHTNENSLDIIKNRNYFTKKFPNMHFIVANQTHSDNIYIVTEAKTKGWESLDTAVADCDALITNQKNIMLTILTADCVPIFLFDKKNHVIACIHAGWRGTEQKIVLKTVKKMQEVFNSNPKNIIAGIAPSIGKCCYEVDWSVTKHFKDIKNAYEKKGKKQMLDLAYINKIQLLESGLDRKNIESSNICTACEVDNYFSYREEKGCSGRFMSMIALR